MGDQLAELKDKFLSLGRADRDELLATIEYETSRASWQPSREEMVVWEALRRLTPGPTIRSLPEFVRDKRHGVGRNAYIEAVETLYDFAREAQPVRHQVQDDTALVELMLRCLADDMTARNIEVNPKSLVEHLPRLRAAVNRAFPGYAEARMLHKLIRVVAVAAE
jgi:hypothetical protein